MSMLVGARSMHLGSSRFSARLVDVCSRARCHVVKRRLPAGLIRRSFFDKVDRDWEKAWQKQMTPWDAGGPAPPLVNMLRDGRLALPQGVEKPRALVPGCGSGYECVELARHGWNVTGLDISTTALTRAREYMLAHEKDEGVRGRVELRMADFYTLPETFHLVFDYTFLCALPPADRPKWAAKMRDLVLPQQGELVTLIFPVHDATPGRALNTTDGPPYEVTPGLYEDLLLSQGFECVSLQPCEDSIKPRRGKEWLGRWRLPG